MKNHNLLQAMFKEATIGILVANVEGKIIEANPYAGRLFGYGEGELNGMIVEALIPDALRRKHVEHRKKYCENPVPRSMGVGLKLFGQRKDGSQFPIEISLSYLKKEGDLFAIAYVSDDSERKEYEKRILEYSDELERKVLERTEELQTSEAKLIASLQKEKELSGLKSRFVSMASHEFRTPLSSILSSANLIGRYEQTDQQDKRMKHVNRIASSVKNLTIILNDFLSLEKLESGKIPFNPVTINLQEFIPQVIGEVAHTSKTNHNIFHQHTGRQEILMDGHLLENILLNLLSNAIKYSPNGKEVKLHTQVESDVFKLQVIDQGIGIPEEEQEHMFTRFFRAHNVTAIQRTGLGLTIVKRYLDLMNGTISFKSAEGKGTTFFLEIPIG